MLINTLLESPDVIAIRGAKIPYSQSKYTFVIANGCVVYTDAKSMYHAQMLNLVQKNLFYAQGGQEAFTFVTQPKTYLYVRSE